MTRVFVCSIVVVSDDSNSDIQKCVYTDMSSIVNVSTNAHITAITWPAGKFIGTLDAIGIEPPVCSKAIVSHVETTSFGDFQLDL